MTNSQYKLITLRLVTASLVLPHIADQISKLAGLKDKGILTEEEFTIQKRKLLGL